MSNAKNAPAKVLAAVCGNKENLKAAGRSTFANPTAKYHRLSLVVDGTEYVSAAALAKELGVSPSKLRRPLRKGKPIQEVVNRLRASGEISA